MKKALLPLLIALLFIVSSHSEINAQICVPDGAYTQTGIWPDSAQGLDTAFQCLPYSQVLTVIVPVDTIVSGFGLWIDSIVVTGIIGFPTGISYACEPPSCSFPGGSTGCILISGTPLTVGIYGLDAYTTTYVTPKLFGSQITQLDTISYYQLVVDTTLFLSTSAVNTSCMGVCDGTALVTPTGGTSPYTYSWNDPSSQSTQQALGLCAGVYAVTVSDASGCSSVDIVTITNGSSLTTTIVTVDATCGLANGAATATITGGASAYTYSWSSGDTTNVASGLNGGVYTVNITDANGCTDSASATINSVAPMTLTYTAVFSTCGNADGSVTVSVSGGTPPYNGWGSTVTDTIITGLAAGSYMVTITDALGCVDSILTTVSDTGGLAISLVASTMASCNGVCDGSGSVIATGAVGALTYSWNTSPVQSTAMATSLCAATHVVTVADSVCTTSLNVIITEPPAIIIGSEIATNPTCNGAGDDNISIVASGGVAPLSYSIDAGATWVSSGVFASPGVGTYTIMVKDSADCMATGSVLTITEPAAVIISAGVSVDISCNGMSDGSIVITASGGTAPLNYSIDGGISFNNTTGSFSGLVAGSYDIAVRDANMCQVMGSTIVITEPASLTASSSSTMESSVGSADGTASTSASGGTGPYTYSWNTTPMQSTATANGLSTGDYVINITDANGCTVSDSVNIGLGTGIDDVTRSLSVFLYPNPAQSVLYVELSLSYDFNFIVYDIRGKQVLTKVMTGGKNSVSLENLSTGLYVYHIFDSSGAALSHGKFNVLK